MDRTLRNLLLLTCLPAVAAAFAYTAAVSRSEHALYMGDFAAANAALAAAIRRENTPRTRTVLLLQKLRVQQIARLSGLPDSNESANLAALVDIAGTSELDRNLKARIQFATTLSQYFQRITGPTLGDLRSLQSGFENAAASLTDPCQRADAVFFAALMLQVENRVAESAPGLRRAEQLARANHCELQLSYDLRHLAPVAEAVGDLAGARELAADSLTLRQRIGFQVFVPYSLLTLAEFDEKLRNRAAASQERQEALQLAEHLHLPAQADAARKALAQPMSH